MSNATVWDTLDLPGGAMPVGKEGVEETEMCASFMPALGNRRAGLPDDRDPPHLRSPDWTEA